MSAISILLDVGGGDFLSAVLVEKMVKRRTMKKSKTLKRKQRGGENGMPNTNMSSYEAMQDQQYAQPVAAPVAAPNATKKNNKSVLNTVANTVSGMFGGKKKSGKKTRKASPWAKAVGKLYQEMKRKDKSTTFMKALKEASKMKKAGTLKL